MRIPPEFEKQMADAIRHIGETGSPFWTRHQLNFLKLIVKLGEDAEKYKPRR